MPNIAQTELYPPKSWDEFEDIVWDLYSRVWGDPNAERYGRGRHSRGSISTAGRRTWAGGTWGCSASGTARAG
jgi:hypothetical protein